MNNKATTGPLRASCERCRAQKLRCVPSSDSDSAGAPCQRCVRAKVADSCVFGSRSRSGRSARGGRSSTSNGSRADASHKDKDTSMPDLPGMSTFSLSGGSFSPSPEPDTPDHLTSLSTKHTPPVFNLDDNAVAVDIAPDVAISDFWQHDPALVDSFSLDGFLQQPFMDDMSIYRPEDGTAGTMKTNGSVDGGAAYFQGLSISPLTTPRPDMDTDMATEEKPGPLVELTALLAQMSPYENRLSKLSGSELHNYPIGDALYLSRRFYAILSEYSHISSGDSSAQTSTPTMLLALSCFITLTRIYSSVFKYLREKLSEMLDANAVHQSGTGAYHSMGVDSHSYRGMRLGQLQTICLCSNWTSAKKAVSILICSLRGAERLLGLPPNVRIIASSSVESEGGQTPRAKSTGRERLVLFEESSMAALTNDRLYKTVGKRAMQVRAEIEEVEELLNGPCGHSFPYFPKVS